LLGRGSDPLPRQRMPPIIPQHSAPGGGWPCCPD
jgi:hypothetical protein